VDQKPRMKSKKKFYRKSRKNKIKEITVIEEIITTIMMEEMAAEMTEMTEITIETLIIGVTKRKEVKSSSRKTNPDKQVDTVAEDPRREITTGIEGMEEPTTTTINSKTRKRKKKLNTKPWLIKK